LLLPQDRHLAAQPAILLLHRLARHRGPGACVTRLLLRPRAQLVRSDIQFSADLRERGPLGSSLCHQPHRLRLELGAEYAPLTPSCCLGFPVRLHVPPPPQK
jgi:hypothetical protein